MQKLKAYLVQFSATPATVMTNKVQYYFRDYVLMNHFRDIYFHARYLFLIFRYFA